MCCCDAAKRESVLVWRTGTVQEKLITRSLEWHTSRYHVEKPNAQLSH
jgi:hypothetical protein